MHRHALRFALVAASLISLRLPAAAAPPARGASSETVRFMGHEFPRAGTAARAAWLSQIQSRVASAALRRAAMSASTPSPDDGRPTLEAWVGNGVPVVSNPVGQIQPSIVSDGAGGAIVAFLDLRNGSPDVYASHLDTNGNVYSGWPADGFPVAVTDSFEVIVTTCSDGSGGAFIGWTTLRTGTGDAYDIYVQRLTSAGAIGAGFPANGKKYAVGQIMGFGMRADGSNGLYVGWLDAVDQARLARLDASGNVIAGWSASGNPIGTTGHDDFDIVPDGSGGTLRVWSSSDSVFCTRMAGDGSFPAGWTADGLLICSGGIDKTTPTITRLSNGNFMLAWEDYRNFDVDIFAQTVTPAGTIPAPWPLNGVGLCTIAGLQTNVRLVPDLSGGACAAWEDYRNSSSYKTLYAQHVTVNAAIAGGWAANGNPLCDALSISKDEFVPVVDNAGGIDVVWDDSRSGTNDIYVQRLLSGGARPPGYPSGGAVLSGTADNQDSPAATTDGGNGVIVAWSDSRGGNRVYAGKILGDGTVGTEAALVSATAEPNRVLLRWFAPNGPSFMATLERTIGNDAFGAIATLQADGTGDLHYEDRDVVPGTEYRYRLMVNDNGTMRALGAVTIRTPTSLEFSIAPVRPNPSPGELTVEFTLASPAPARLDVLDVAGRRMLSRDASLGAGRHVVRLSESAELKAGVYLVRLEQAGRTVKTRAVIAP